MEFENFLADMGDKPKGMTLERIDNDGDYEPSNCKWATMKEQSGNTRCNKPFVVHREIDKSFIGEWKNQKQCAQELDLWATDISSCLRGKRKSVRGYEFKFVQKVNP